MTTPLYEGTKRVHAKPMNRGDYNSYRGWEVPADENPADEGYLVEYVDGGRGNDSRHAGYISWSPKDVFERSYKEVKTVPGLAPHQQRVVDEKQDLDLRIESPVESQRERLRRECELILVHGAASVIANRPSQAREVADGIKAFLYGLEVGAEDQAQAGDSLVCKGINCGCTDGQSHSNECIVEAAMIQGWAGDKEARDAFAAIQSKTFSSRAATESVATQPAASPTPVDDAIEAEIQAKGLTAPRVTPAALKDEIVSEHYFTAADGARMSPDGNWPIHNLNTGSLGLLTFCVLVLRNGFAVYGASACASPENFNAEIGRRIARENAEREIWPLLGFRLRDELARPVLTDADAAADLAGTPRPT